MTFGGPSLCRNSSAPQTLSFSSAAISSLLTLITVPGNFLICLAVAKDPRKNLRTSFNLFLLNISAADLLVGFTVLPASVVYHALEGLGMAYSALTKALHLSFFISCSASVLSIAALSVDRYICVTSPIKYRTRLTSRQVRKVSLGIWLVSVAAPFTYLYVDFIVYTFVFVNSTILFTLVVMIFVNHKISHSLRTHRRQLQTLAQAEGFKTYLLNRDSQVNRTFFLILFSFIVLTLPPMAFSYILNFCSSCDCWMIHIFRDIQFLSILFPSSVNPFIYALRLPNFKQALKLIFDQSFRNSIADNSEVPIDESTLSQPVMVKSVNRKWSCSSTYREDTTINLKDATSDIAKLQDSVLLKVKKVEKLGPRTAFISRNFTQGGSTPKHENGISKYYRMTTTL